VRIPGHLDGITLSEHAIGSNRQKAQKDQGVCRNGRWESHSAHGSFLVSKAEHPPERAAKIIDQ